MRRASRGRLDAPVSCSEVCGKDIVAEDVPLESCVFGWVGGLGLGALEAFVAGGVEMPFWRASAAMGDAMVGSCGEWARCGWGVVL